MEQHRFEFRVSNGFPSSCVLTVYRDIQLVVASETGEGMRWSAGAVTNAAGIIATEVVSRHGLDPRRMLFVENYPADHRPTFGESYDLVTFTWDANQARNPDWRHLRPAEFHEILNTVAT